MKFKQIFFSKNSEISSIHSTTCFEFLFDFINSFIFSKLSCFDLVSFFDRFLFFCTRKKINKISFFQLSQYYSNQNHSKGLYFSFYPLIINKSKTNLHIKKKVIDLLIQVHFFDISSISEPKKINFLTIKTVNYKTGVIFKKWFIISYLQQSKIFNRKEDRMSNFKILKNESKMFIFFKLFFQNIMFQKISTFGPDNKNSYNLDNRTFNKNLSYLGDFFWMNWLNQLKKLSKIPKNILNTCIVSFLNLILNHGSFRIIFPLISSIISMKISFKVENLFMNESKEFIEKIYISKLLNVNSKVCRGFFVRILKIFGFFKIFIIKISISKSKFDMIKFVNFKIKYSILGSISFNYTSISDKLKGAFLEKENTKKLFFMTQKIVFIFFKKNLSYNETKRYLNRFILWLQLIKKRLKILNTFPYIGNSIKEIDKINIFKNFNFTKKLVYLGLIPLEFNLLTDFLHELIFIKNYKMFRRNFFICLLKKKVKKFNQIDKICMIVKNIKKKFQKSNFRKNCFFLNKYLKIKIREKIKNPRYICSFLERNSNLEENFFSKKIIKKYIAETSLLLSFFLKTYENLNISNKISVNNILKKLECQFKSKKLNLRSKFFCIINNNKKKIFGVCLFCYTKERNKIQNYLKLSFKNFFKLQTLNLVSINKFPIWYQTLFVISKYIENSQCNNLEKKKEIALSTKNNSHILFFIRFKKKKNLTTINLTESISFPTSFFQNIIIYSINYIEDFSNLKFNKYLNGINCLKNNTSMKFSFFGSPIAELISHKNYKKFEWDITVSGEKKNNDIKHFLTFIAKNISKYKIFIFRLFLENFSTLFIFGKNYQKKILKFLILINFKRFLKFFPDYHIFKKIPKKKCLKIKKEVHFYIILSKYRNVFNSKVFCKFLDCNRFFNFNLNFFPRKSNIFINKLNSEFFLNLFFKTKYFYFLSRKNKIKFRNLLIKSKFSEKRETVDFDKRNKIFFEIKKNGDKNDYGLLFLICSLGYIKNYIKKNVKSGQNFTSPTYLKNFFPEFLRFNHLCLVSNLFGNLSFDRNLLFAIKKRHQKFSNIIVLILNIGFLHFSSSSTLFIKNNVHQKNSKDNLKCTMTKKWPVFFNDYIILQLFIKNFIFSNKKFFTTFLAKFTTLKIKRADISLIIRCLDFLFLNDYNFKNIISKIKFLKTHLIFQLRFRFLCYSTWVYNPLNIKWKNLFILIRNQKCKILEKSLPIFKFKKKLTYINFKKKKLDISSTKKNINKLLAFFYNHKEEDGVFSTTFLIKNTWCTKLQINQNLIFKKKNFKKPFIKISDRYRFLKQDMFFLVFNMKLRSSKFITNIFKKNGEYSIFNFNKIANLKSEKEILLLLNQKHISNFLNLETNDCSSSFSLFEINTFQKKKKKKKNTRTPGKIFYFSYFLKNQVHYKDICFIKDSYLFFISHFVLESLKSYKYKNNLFLLNFIYEYLEHHKKKFSRQFFLISFSFSPPTFESDWCKRLKILDFIIFYKKSVLIFLIQKKIMYNNSIKIFEKFLSFILKHGRDFLIKFSSKLGFVYTYLKKLLYSKHLILQYKGIDFFEKFIRFSPSILFNRFVVLKFIFLKIFISPLFTKSKPYLIFLKLMEKNWFPINYSLTFFKILVTFLKVKKSFVKKNSQILLYLLILFVNQKKFSIISKKFTRKIFKCQFLLKFKSSFFSFFSLSIFSALELDCDSFLYYKMDMFNGFFKNNFHQKEAYFEKIFEWYLQNLENNRLNFFIKKHLEKKCLCCNERIISEFKKAMKLNLSVHINKTTKWIVSIKSFFKKNRQNLDFYETLKSNTLTFFGHKIFLIGFEELCLGNIYIIHSLKYFSKFFCKQFHSSQINTFEKKNFEKFSFFISYPSLIKYSFSTRTDKTNFYIKKKKIFGKKFASLIHHTSYSIEMGFLRKNYSVRFTDKYNKNQKKIPFLTKCLNYIFCINPETQLFFISKILKKLNQI